MIGGSLVRLKARGYVAYAPILFSERYVRTLTYSILAYVNKNRIRTQTMITEAANWFFATFIINLLSDSAVQNIQFD